MKAKLRMDPWKLITIGVILLYAIFLLYPVGKLLLQAFVDKTSGDIIFNF